MLVVRVPLDTEFVDSNAIEDGDGRGPDDPASPVPEPRPVRLNRRQKRALRASLRRADRTRARLSHAALRQLRLEDGEPAWKPEEDALVLATLVECGDVTEEDANNELVLRTWKREQAREEGRKRWAERRRRRRRG